MVGGIRWREGSMKGEVSWSKMLYGGRIIIEGEVEWRKGLDKGRNYIGGGLDRGKGEMYGEV